MISFYLLPKEVADSSHNMFALQGYEFIEWYKISSEKYSFSEKFNTTNFIQNEKVNYILTTRILNNSIENREDSSEYIYFYLPSFFANAILEELIINSKKNKEEEVFSFILNEIKEGRSSCIVKYSKKNGWFDFYEVLKQKIIMEQKFKNERNSYE